MTINYSGEHAGQGANHQTGEGSSNQTSLGSGATNYWGNNATHNNYGPGSAHTTYLIHNLNDERSQFMQAIVRINASAQQSISHAHPKIGTIALGRAPGTCEWIFSNPKYQQWVQRPCPQVLLIVGDPGMGKTVLATSITERLERETPHEKAIVTYFFCNHQKPGQKSGIAIITGLLHRLLEQVPPAFQPLRSKWKEMKQAAWRDVSSAWTLFVRVVACEHVPKVLAVIDGIDECQQDTADEFIQRINDLLRRQPSAGAPTSACASKLKVVLLCRRHVACKLDRRRPDLISCLELGPFHIRDDVEKYIRFSVKQISTSRRWSQSTISTACAALAQSHEGTFLWVSHVLESLEELDANEVAKELEFFNPRERVPTKFSKYLSRIVRESPPVNVETMRYAMGIVVYFDDMALLLEEIVIAVYFCLAEDEMRLSIPSDDELYDYAGAVQNCALLRIATAGDVTLVSPLHSAIGTYLMADVMTDRPSGLQLQGNDLMAATTEACLLYITSLQMKSIGTALEWLNTWSGQPRPHMPSVTTAQLAWLPAAAENLRHVNWRDRSKTPMRRWIAQADDDSCDLKLSLRRAMERGYIEGVAVLAQIQALCGTSDNAAEEDPLSVLRDLIVERVSHDRCAVMETLLHVYVRERIRGSMMESPQHLLGSVVDIGLLGKAVEEVLAARGQDSRPLLGKAIHACTSVCAWLATVPTDWSGSEKRVLNLFHRHV